jgi:hypothetical protein
MKHDYIFKHFNIEPEIEIQWLEWLQKLCSHNMHIVIDSTFVVLQSNNTLPLPSLSTDDSGCVLLSWRIKNIHFEIEARKDNMLYWFVFDLESEVVINCSEGPILSQEFLSIVRNIK